MEWKIGTEKWNGKLYAMEKLNGKVEWKSITEILEKWNGKEKWDSKMKK